MMKELERNEMEMVNGGAITVHKSGKQYWGQCLDVVNRSGNTMVCGKIFWDVSKRAVKDRYDMHVNAGHPITEDPNDWK